jgi:aminomuconate-semialdehyde/2-hydroxymuconate-6-semialdehyde dehydrogenase
MAQTKIQNFIDGKFQDPINGKWFEKIDPALGKLAYYVPDSDMNDIEAAVEAAKRAFPLWSKTPRQKRAEFLNKIADAIEKHLVNKKSKNLFLQIP